MQSLQVLSAIAVARHELRKGPTAAAHLGVSARALAIFASGAWARREPPAYTATLVGEMWRLAKDLGIDDAFILSISRVVRSCLHKRICFEEVRLAGASPSQLFHVSTCWDPGIRGVDIVGEHKHWLTNFGTGPLLPFGQQAREALDATRLPSKSDELCKFLLWPEERRQKITAVYLTAFNARERLLLSLLPNTETLYFGDEGLEVEDINACLALPGKICRLVLLKSRVDKLDLPNVARQLNNAGIELVLHEVEVPSDQHFVIEDRCPANMAIREFGNQKATISARLSATRSREESRVPPIDWTTFVLSCSDFFNAAHAKVTSQYILMMQNPRLPQGFIGEWIVQNLHKARADDYLHFLVVLLCEQYDSLQEVPSWEKVAEVLKGYLGDQALKCLASPESWRALRQVSILDESMPMKFSVHATVFGEDLSETIANAFEFDDCLRMLATSSDEVKRCIFACMNGPHKTELTVELLAHLMSVYGPALSYEGSVQCNPSSLYQYLKEGPSTWLVEECPIILRIGDGREADWALALPRDKLWIEGLDLSANGMDKCSDLLKKHFPRVTQVWTATEPQDRPQLGGSAGAGRWRTNPQDFVHQLRAAAERAKAGKPAQLHLYLKTLENRDFSNDQFNEMADIAIDVLAVGAMDSSTLDSLRKRLETSQLGDNKLILKFRDGELTISRRHFRLESQTATRATTVVELPNTSERVVVQLQRCLERRALSSKPDLTPREARELRELCLLWDLPGPKRILEKYLLTEQPDNVFFTYEEWEKHYLQTLSADERAAIEEAWLTKWTGPEGLLSMHGWHHLPQGIDFCRTGCLTEDSALGALLRRQVTTLHLPTRLPLQVSLDSCSFIPTNLRAHFKKLVVDDHQDEPPLPFIRRLFPNAEMLVVGRNEFSLAGKPSDRTLTELKGYLLPGKCWLTRNLHLTDDISDQELDVLMPSLLTHAPNHPLTTTDDGVKFLLSRLPGLAQPRELLSVLDTLNKIRPADYSSYQLPKESLPQTDAPWVQVCPFTGRAKFSLSGPHIPADPVELARILKPFSQVCIRYNVGRQQAANLPTILAGKQVRFWDFTINYLNDTCEERTYPAQ